MFQKKINKISNEINILIVPLDWGLGHVTRCIPLIKTMMALNCKVFVAVESTAKTLLEIEFQNITFIPIEGYRVSYTRNPVWLPLKILAQSPSIVYSIYKEHRWLKKVEKKYAINAIFSDNRFGLYHSSIPSIYLTHQLSIKTNDRYTEKIVQKIHYWFINKYTECWVPDFSEKNNLAGQLSHPVNLPRNTKYIGCLSRFEKKEVPADKKGLLILLSGPEPQRTIFEDILLKQLPNYEGSVLLVRGLPGLTAEPAGMLTKHLPNVRVQNHLPAAALNEAIQNAEWVICRSGYTTIMDLVKLQQKAILVPTPGQTEQEYLARHLLEQQYFYATRQQGFILKKAMQEAADFPFIKPSFDMELYKTSIEDFVQSL